MRTLAGFVTALFLLAAPAIAVAQPKKDAKPAPKDAGKDAPKDAPKNPEGAGAEVEMGEDATPIADESGMEENPDDPGGGGGPSGQVRKRAPAEPMVYPAEIARRPITLHAGMTEAMLDYPVYFDPLRTAGQLRAAYGITGQIEVQLRYGIGSYSDDASKYFTGKSVAIGGIYQLKPYLGIQLEVPILLDPFAMGVTLGAPLKFRFSKFSLFVGRDLVTIKLAKFAPVVEDALATEARRAAEAVGTTPDRGTLRIVGGIIYTLKPKMSITGETGIVANDFAMESPDGNYVLRVGLTMNSKKFDYGARVGIDNLDFASETLNLALFGSLRI